MSSLTQKEFGRRFRKALSVPFMLDQACSATIQEFLKSYSAAVGCNEKCILFPLLTCCAACMGPNAHLELSKEWHEVPIIWTLVITPMTLYRVSVADHLKQQLLTVQEEIFGTKSEDGDGPMYSKFLIDVVTQEDLHQMLVNNSGQALGVYNSTRPLQQLMGKPESEDVMLRLHAGSSWFTDNTKINKKLLTKTQVNFAVLANPSAVCNSLVSNTGFADIYTDCFLTICAEENHIKFSQLQDTSASEDLKKLFKEIINVHLRAPVVYRLSAEAAAKYAEIHDAITDKAKQIARKSPDKVFHPAVSYLGRLTCVLHVLENVLYSMNLGLPIDPLTWDCKIGPDTVWRARQLLGYVIEQKYSLSQPTTVTTPNIPAKVEAVTVVDGNPNRMTQMRSPAPIVLPRQPRTQTMMNVPTQRPQYYTRQNSRSSVRYVANSVPQAPSSQILTPQRTPQRRSDAFDLLLASSPSQSRVQSNGITKHSEVVQNEPLIVGIASAGLPVPVDKVLNTSKSNANGLVTESFVTPSLSMTCVTEPETILPTIQTSGNANVDATPQSIALMTNDDFFHAFKVHIRRLLVHDLKEITLQQCVVLKFAPKGTRVDTKDSSDQRIAMARLFLSRIETLGFGVFDAPNGMGAQFCIFKKNPFNALSEEQKKLLKDLRITDRDYEKCFESTTASISSVVCLE